MLLLMNATRGVSSHLTVLEQTLAALQEYLTRHPSLRARRVKVDAYLFAPPNVGNRRFVAAYNKMVNARR